MKKLNKKGFSLVELIIVIAIMLVLVGVLAPTYLGQVKKSKRATDVQNAQEIATMIAVYAANEEATGVEDASKKITKITGTNYGTIPTEVGTLPTIQVKSGCTWAYQYDEKQVSVFVKDGSSYIELYPNASTSYGN